MVTYRYTRLLACLALLGFAGGFYPTVASAVDAPLPTPANFVAQSDLKIGGFSILPTISTGLETTSNIEGDPSERSGFLGQFMGSISAERAWEQFSLNSSLSVQHQEPIDSEAIDSTAMSALVFSRYALSEAWSINLGLEHAEDIVTTTNPYQFSGNINGVTQTQAVSLGVTWAVDKYTASLSGRFQDIISDTEVSGSTASQLDRYERDLSFKVTRAVNDGAFYVYGGLTEIDYAAPGIQRDSEAVNLGVGRSWVTKDYSFTAEFGGLWQRFLAGPVPINRGLVGMIEGTVALDDHWTFGATVSRSFAEQNVAPDSAGLYENEFSIGLQTLLHEDVLLRFGPTYRQTDFDNESLELDAYSFDAMLMWQILPDLQMPVMLSYLTQEGNDPVLAASDFDELSLTVSLVKSF